uniref:Cadherin-89D n=1 Tax=Cacopsylla melanoneura TaxID=428564 RepID=A0A8D8TMI4_9HEMI
MIVGNEGRYLSVAIRTYFSQFHFPQGHKIHYEIRFDPPIMAEDQDKGINTTLRYDIASGNDKHLFYIDPNNGTLFLERELDLDVLSNNLFNLQVSKCYRKNINRFGFIWFNVRLTNINRISIVIQ